MKTARTTIVPQAQPANQPANPEEFSGVGPPVERGVRIGSADDRRGSDSVSRLVAVLAMPLLLGTASMAANSSKPGPIMVFTDRASWEAAVSGQVNDDLNSEPIGSYLPPYSTSGGWTISSNGPSFDVDVADGGANGTRDLSLFDFLSQIDATVSLPMPGGEAFGFDYATPFGFNGLPWDLRVGGFSVATLPENTIGFIGVLSTSAINSFDLISPDDTLGGIGLDDLSRATAFDPCSGYVPDAFEDNDSCATAANLAGGVTGLNVSTTDVDWYEIAVPDGADVEAEAMFIHANGDIDLELWSSCGGVLLDSSTGASGSEIVNWSNMTGAPTSVLLHAFIAGGSASDCNGYDLELGLETPIPCVPAGDLTAAAAAPKILRHIVPKAWQRPVIEWNRDQSPQNKIDDLIDAAPAGLHAIVVNYRRKVETADATFIDGLSGTSQVDLIGEVIPSIAAGGLSYADIQTIAALAEVAFVELQPTFSLAQETALQSVGVTASAFHSPDTLEDCYPAISGSGVTIAIIDSGVDNTVHGTFGGVTLMGAYDVVTTSYVDPDDQHGHGTAVASIALGRGFGGITRGVANGANLVDVRVTQSGSFSYADLYAAVQVVYDNRDAWGVDIMNLSLVSTGSSDGTDSMSQLIDLADEMGILCVVSVGSNGPAPVGIASPASASRALTVAASDDGGSTNPALQTLANFSSRGPRDDDFDFDFFDELKPDVTAPGVGITTAAHNSLGGTATWSGTSMSAPIVAGLAGLLLEQYPGMTPAGLKHAIMESATQMVPPNEEEFPGWDDGWGRGLINAKAAFDSFPSTNLRFPGHPANPGWMSPDLSTTPSNLNVNVLTMANAMVENAGPNDAFGARVVFGIHDYTGSQPPYFEIGSVVIDFLASGDSVEVSVPWTPQEPGHQCLKAEIAYAGDSDLSDDNAGRNLNVANSPIKMQIANYQTLYPQEIFMSVTCDGPNAAQWTVTADPPIVTLAAGDGPIDVEFLARPALGLADGDEIIVNVETRSVSLGVTKLGGASFIVRKKDCNGNSTDDYFDILNGTSADLNGNGIPDECDPDAVGYGYCVSGPCGNDQVNAGCTNSTGVGAVVTASGSSSVSNDDLVLTMSDLPPNKFGLFFNGPTQGAGLTFGDGLRVVVGSIRRFPVMNSGAAGSISFGPVVGYTLANFPVAQQIQAGSQWNFQGWYRDPAGPCGSGFNLTHGLSVNFTP